MPGKNPDAPQALRRIWLNLRRSYHLGKQGKKTQTSGLSVEAAATLLPQTTEKLVRCVAKQGQANRKDRLPVGCSGIPEA